MNSSLLISFSYDPTLVALRRQQAPRAYWVSAQRAWRMPNGDAKDFIKAADAALAAQEQSAEIVADGVVNYVGAPPRVTDELYRTPELRPARTQEERKAQNAAMIAWCRADCVRRAATATL